MDRKSLTQRGDFRSLINHLEDIAIWIVTNPEEFDYISAGFEDIWGIPTESVEDDLSLMIEGIHPDDRDKVLSVIERSEEELSEEVIEHRVVNPDGTVRWVHARLFPFREDEGDQTVLVGISTDITPVKRREKELEALNRILRHDIRNDMNVILGWAELLEQHVDSDGKAQIQKILAAGEHVIELTAIAKDHIETLTGDAELTIQPVPLSSILETEVSLAKELFPEADFAFTGQTSDVEVMANQMLPSVFKNLLNNAVQHNNTGEPFVEVSYEIQTEDVVVYIADNGQGISEEEKAHLFEKGHKGIKSSGTGIGLYLVRTLIEQYDGSIWVEDNTPTGTIFTVKLPKAN